MKVRRFIPGVLLGSVCLLMLGFYAWTARPNVEQIYNPSNPADAYYNQLVQGFRNGQLNLKREAPPGLMALADPYDPVANAPYRRDGLHDISYYKGKLYLYFGVTPAMVLFWPYAALTGHYLWHKQAVAIFCAVGFLASVALLCALRRRYFPEVGGAVVAAGALALGLATGVPVMLQRPDVWEVPISCAYAMVMLGLAGIWCALHDPVRRCRWLAAASLAFGLAVGARPTVLFGAVILLVPVVHAHLFSPVRNGQRWFVTGRMLAAAVAPILFVGLGLMLYNYLRFDNPLEFGLHYQLVANRQHKLPHMLSLDFFWFNFRLYFLQPIHWGGSYPFVQGIKVPRAPAGQLGVEDAFGVLPNLPFVWMALAVPLTWRKRVPGDHSALPWFIAAVAVFLGFSALTICLYPGACMRYQVEFMPELVLLAVCGIFGLERALAAKPGRRGAVRCTWIAALVFSVVLSLLVSIQIYVTAKRFQAGLDQISMDRPNEAILCFEQVLRIKPGYADAHNNLGLALVKVGRISEAISQFEEALRINPDHEDAHYNLGVALDKVGRIPEAVFEFKEAVRVDPDYAEAHFNLGTIFGRAGRISEAIGQLEEAVRLKPDYAEAHKNLGLALYQAGRIPEAMAECQEALRINPDYAEARAVLEKIQAAGK